MKECSVVLVPVLKDVFNLSVPLQCGSFVCHCSMEPGGSCVCPQEKPLLVIIKLFLFLVNSWKYLYLWYVNICHSSLTLKWILVSMAILNINPVTSLVTYC